MGTEDMPRGASGLQHWLPHLNALLGPLRVPMPALRPPGSNWGHYAGFWGHSVCPLGHEAPHMHEPPCPAARMHTPHRLTAQHLLPHLCLLSCESGHCPRTQSKPHSPAWGRPGDSPCRRTCHLGLFWSIRPGCPSPWPPGLAALEQLPLDWGRAAGWSRKAGRQRKPLSQVCRPAPGADSREVRRERESVRMQARAAQQATAQPRGAGPPPAPSPLPPWHTPCQLQTGAMPRREAATSCLPARSGTLLLSRTQWARGIYCPWETHALGSRGDPRSQRESHPPPRPPSLLQIIFQAAGATLGGIRGEKGPRRAQLKGRKGAGFLPWTYGFRPVPVGGRAVMG